MSQKIVVIGARRAKQGIGQFVAGWFADLGCDVVGVVGSRPETIAQVQSTLKTEYGIDCRGYENVAEALAAEKPDIAALCTPIRFRQSHLPAIMETGVHCLCEKPFCWSDPATDRRFVENVAANFVRKNRLLKLITQWPFTLDAYYRVHSEQTGAAIERFEMNLSPVTAGLDMVVDCASHPISMLRRLMGSGTAENCRARFLRGDRSHLRLDFAYRHRAGETQVGLDFALCPTRPAPAGFAINGCGVTREVDIAAGYAQYFRSGDLRVEVADPTRALIADFLRGVSRDNQTDRTALLEDQENLVRLYSAAKNAL